MIKIFNKIKKTTFIIVITLLVNITLINKQVDFVTQTKYLHS